MERAEKTALARGCFTQASHKERKQTCICVPVLNKNADSV